jgi:hypothetical protein
VYFASRFPNGKQPHLHIHQRLVTVTSGVTNLGFVQFPKLRLTVSTPNKVFLSRRTGRIEFRIFLAPQNTIHHTYIYPNKLYTRCTGVGSIGSPPTYTCGAPSSSDLGKRLPPFRNPFL